MAELAAILQRGGRAEFVAPQRLGFELVVHVRAGRTRHEVDFAVYDLRPGDVLWVHEGQLHHWGDIAALQGLVVMFPAGMLTDHARATLAGLRVWDRNHWSGAAAPGTALATALDLLPGTVRRTVEDLGLDPRARDAAVEHAATAVLLHLAGSQVADSRAATASSEAFVAFRAALDRDYATRRTVSGYAALLGYSERTLNRATRAAAGMNAKALIDERVVLEAKRRLVYERTAVGTIARELGFDDAANFSRFFTQRVGLAPGAFRASRRA
ncbi:helix-turn-helix domain-containing protein [Cellulomonas iranensis]|uniref:helix-turn-helix domain-containing protein n=1 Tax=Cellulomonas iranensis TaxID=76862 RepID=UPI000B3CE942|nr:AraC family transcriptional regulator [Cellulomonas iranensis]